MAGTGLPCKDQMAVALAASPIAFRQSDPLYANKLLSTATRGFGYADTYNRAYLQLLRIEEEFGAEAVYAGAIFRKPVEPY
ncbi:bifunctional enolase 2/transcriptional activator [Tanacetum coccineum]